MLICHSRRWVYVGPPKTASTTLHQWLSQPALWDAASDEKLDGPDQQHLAEIPPGCREYLIVFSCRDEAERTRSLWRHHLAAARRGEHQLLSWPEFLRWRANQAGYFYGWDHQRYAHTAGRIDERIAFERLRRDALRLPFVAAAGELQPLPHLNVNRQAPPE